MKGGYAGEAGEYLNPLAEYTGRLRASFVPPSVADVVELSLPTRPPMGVVHHLPTEIMVSAVDVAPRGLHVLVYYICPRNPRVRVHRVPGKNRLVTGPATGAVGGAAPRERYCIAKIPRLIKARIRGNISDG